MHADRAGRAWIVPLQREGEGEHQRRARGQQPKGVDVGQRLRLALHHPVEARVRLALRLPGAEPGGGQAMHHVTQLRLKRRIVWVLLAGTMYVSTQQLDLAVSFSRSPGCASSTAPG